MKKRLFIAVDISDEARKAAARYIEQMSKLSGHVSVKWERPEKLHLTLKFLGSTEEFLIPEVIDLVDRQSKTTKPFTIEIGSTGAFPSARSPRVLWLGVNEVSGAMKDLAKRIEADCAALGFEPENRSFKPHLTLARIREPRSAGSLGVEHAANKFGPITFICKEVVIYESHLGRSGSTYEKLHAADFAG